MEQLKERIIEILRKGKPVEVFHIVSELNVELSEIRKAILSLKEDGYMVTEETIPVGLGEYVPSVQTLYFLP